jgi:hypothetical protein
MLERQQPAADLPVGQRKAPSPCSHLPNGAHAMGFGGKMLSGIKVGRPTVTHFAA